MIKVTLQIKYIVADTAHMLKLHSELNTRTYFQVNSFLSNKYNKNLQLLYLFYRGKGLRNSFLGSRLQKHTTPARVPSKHARKNARRGSVFQPRTQKGFRQSVASISSGLGNLLLQLIDQEKMLGKFLRVVCLKNV